MTHGNKSIHLLLGKYPIADTSITPTPIHQLKRLSILLGYNIYIKREDLTGFTLGGNKNRKLYYLIGDAISKGFDTLITTGIHFNKILHACGSTATQVGLVLGNIVTNNNSTIIGIAISQNKKIQIERIHKLAQSTASMLDISDNKSSIKVDDKFLGSGYSIPSKEGINATKLFATYEGILLDSVYTAKATAGLIHYAQNKLFNKDDNILFIHTRGNSGLFC